MPDLDCWGKKNKSCYEHSKCKCLCGHVSFVWSETVGSYRKGKFNPNKKLLQMLSKMILPS